MEGKLLNDDIVYVEIHAYNAEQTIERAIESILNQTYGNLVLHVLDNASTDSTLSIIMKYAKEDSRVIPYHFTNNCSPKWMDYIIKILFSRIYLRPVWYASLSADDEYDITCFEKLLNFAREFDLDIAACRSHFIGDVKGRTYNKGINLNNNIIIEGNDFDTLFPVYWRYFRANWGHIVKIPQFDPTEFSNIKSTDPEYGGDNKFMLKMMENARKIGVVNEELHKYYIHEGTLSMQYTENRHEASYNLTKLIYNYLNKKVGYVSEQNEQFIYRRIYLRHLMNAFPIICNADIPEDQKLYELNCMLTNDITKELMRKEYITQAEKLECFKFVYSFLYSHTNEAESTHNIEKQLIDVLSPLYKCETV